MKTREEIFSERRLKRILKEILSKQCTVMGQQQVSVNAIEKIIKKEKIKIEPEF